MSSVRFFLFALLLIFGVDPRVDGLLGHLLLEEQKTQHDEFGEFGQLSSS